MLETSLLKENCGGFKMTMRPDTKQKVNEWMENNRVYSINWPEQSLDLNPLENLWRGLGQLSAKTSPQVKVS